MRACPDLSWQNLEAVRFSALEGARSGLHFFRSTYPLLRCLRSHQDCASGHFFSDALPLRWAREVGGIDRRPYLSARFSHSSSGSLAACLAQPSAISLPGMPLCAGHQRISNSMAASRSRRAAVASPPVGRRSGRGQVHHGSRG